MQLTVANLIDHATGKTNLPVLKAMTRRRAMADYGNTSPRAIRQALRFYGSIIEQHRAAWCQRNGQTVEMIMVSPFGKQRDGVRRSAF